MTAPSGSAATGGPEDPQRSGGRAAGYARGYRRSVRVGLLVSAVLHAFLILVLSRELYIGARPFRTIEAPPRVPAGIQVVEFQVSESDVADAEVVEVLPAEREDIPRPEPPLPGAGTPVPAPGVAEVSGMTNAERLRLQEGDPRLWRDFGDEPLPEYLEEGFARAEGILRSRLGAMLDSLRLSEEQRRRAVEWLMGEGDQQWGVTPEGLVLGGIVIPMNVGALFQAEGPLGRELREQERDLADIRRQDFETDVERTQQNRREEMRRRSREEAERRDRDSTAAPRDTLTAGAPSSRE